MSGNTVTTNLFQIEDCFICLNKGYYKDSTGVWHKCPRGCSESRDNWYITDAQIKPYIGRGPLPSVRFTYSYDTGIKNDG